jgi:hypothetical protein
VAKYHNSTRGKRQCPVETNRSKPFDHNYVVYANYFLVGGDVSVDNETLLMIDFINFKIKLTQSFGSDVFIGVDCVCVFIELSASVYEYPCVILHF